MPIATLDQLSLKICVLLVSFLLHIDSILVVLFECRFLATEVDGSNLGNSMLLP